MMDTQQDNEINGMASDLNGKPETQASVGRILRAAREEMGLSINDVANRIKFAQRQIEALEADDFTQLPEAAFVRGFVRSYARLLDIDPVRLLPALPSSHLKISSEQEVRSVEIPMPTELSARRHNIVLLAVGLVIALSVAIFERMNDSAPEVVGPVTDTAVQTLDLPDVAAGGASAPLSVQEQPLVAVQQKTVRTVPLRAQATQQYVSRQPAPVAPEAAQVQQPSAPRVVSAEPATGLPPAAGQQKQNAPISTAGHALRLEFDEDAWVEIKDGNDKILISRMHSAGSLVRVSGNAPLMVTIGNARAVRLFDNGRQINLERYTTAEVAHITLK